MPLTVAGHFVVCTTNCLWPFCGVFFQLLMAVLWCVLPTVDGHFVVCTTNSLLPFGECLVLTPLVGFLQLRKAISGPSIIDDTGRSPPIATKLHRDRPSKKAESATIGGVHLEYDKDRGSSNTEDTQKNV